jgi:ferrochelatase
MTGPAVILMAYGSPDRLADVPAYYSDIRGGRPIRPELVDDLVARYRALGIDDGDGPSPLNAITEETRAALEAVLGIPVLTGMRHWDPRIAAAVEAALGAGSAPILGLVLAPHWSTLSIAKYEGLFDQAVAGRAETRFVRSWSDDPGFIALLADRILAARTDPPHVVFTAHSLPARIIDEGDTYRDALLETSRLVAGAAGIGDWSFAFQSESPTGEPWLGPDILDELERLHGEGASKVLVAPVGFVSDHLEILWDLEIEAREKAAELGLELERMASLNDDPAFMSALAGVVQRARVEEPAMPGRSTP